jgi:lactoylglutathione lyase
MTINHVNLTVTDPVETSAFLAKYFGLRPEGGNAAMRLMFDDNHMVITLMKGRPEDREHGDSRETSARSIKYPSSFHIGFFVESRERVNRINQHLRDDGYVVDPPGPSHGDWGFYFKAPGGFTIEVAA